MQGSTVQLCNLYIGTTYTAPLQWSWYIILYASSEEFSSLNQESGPSHLLTTIFMQIINTNTEAAVTCILQWYHHTVFLQLLLLYYH